MHYTAEHIEFIRSEASKGICWQEIYLNFTKKFPNADVTIEKIKATGKRYKIRNNHDTRIKKGDIPKNKGKKMSPEQYKKVSKTFFKKGHVPVNKKPIGSKKITKDGYIRIKTKEGGTQAERWPFEHRYVWEQAYGPIPKGYNVTFLDDDKTNLSLDNLMLISDREHGQTIRIRNGNADLAKAAILNARLGNRIEELK